MNPQFRVASRKDLQAIMRLVEEARNWAEKNDIKQTVDSSDEKELGAQIDSGEVYICGENCIVATYTLQPIPRGSADEWHFVPDIKGTLNLESTLSLKRFVVARKFSGMKLGYCVLDKACETVHALGKSTLIIDCWAGNGKLREYYIGAGCSLLTIAQKRDNENYRIAIFQRRCK